MRLGTASTKWNVPGRCGPHGELFFFLIKKELVVASADVSSNPFLSAETLKACALTGLHLLAEGDAGSSGSQSPDVGHVWRHGCPKSPDADGDVKSWTENEGASSSEQCEHNVESLALKAMVQDQSGERSLSSWKILGTCEGGSELPQGPGLVVPGNARGLVAGLQPPTGLAVMAKNVFSHRGRAVIAKERDVVRE